MKLILISAFFPLVSLVAAADSKVPRKPASNISAGSYQCENANKETIASFYIRNDGTSKKVEILNAQDEQDGSGAEGCSRVSFRWVVSQKVVKDVYCCPFGAN